jgi:tRNA1Val (adenine37-N6)-methyltransferase
MGNSIFKFKQFTIKQDKCAMKISTDAVLLGALAGEESPAKVLDIGTGTGVVALMLAQRFADSQVTGVEIDASAALQALENCVSSPWKARIRVLHQPFQEFVNTQEKFDLIVSNPPYYTNHLKTTDQRRNLALHADTLQFEDLASGVNKLLAAQGQFWIILPPIECGKFVKLAKEFQLNPFCSYHVKDRPGKKVLRIITGFSFQDQGEKTKEINIKNLSGKYHIEYQCLLKDFLMIF